MRGTLTGGIILTLVALTLGCSDSTGPGDLGTNQKPAPNGTLAPVERFAIEASPSTITAKRSLQVTATAVRAGKESPVPPRDIVWESSDTTVATVSSSGLVRGVRAGQTDIRAFWLTNRATVRITVVTADDPSCPKDICL